MKHHTHVAPSGISIQFSAIFLILLVLSGCGPSDSEKTSQQNTADIQLNRQDSTGQYAYSIKLPPVIRTHKAIRDTLTAIANRQQQSFVSRASRDTLNPQRPGWELKLNVTVQDSTSNFITVLGEGYEYMGGAHGAPFFITLNYDRERERFVDLRDLLADSTGLVTISDYVRKELPKIDDGNRVLADSPTMLDGTEPRYSNYTNVLVRPQGLRIIFDSYQVGPYAIGTPEIAVPVSVFREELEPQFTEWF